MKFTPVSAQLRAMSTRPAAMTTNEPPSRASGRTKVQPLATGGGGKAWHVTSNSWEYTGDGAALAYEAGAELIADTDPVILPKACKNAVEIEGSRRAHLRDAIAEIRCLSWLDAEVAAGRLHDPRATVGVGEQEVAVAALPLQPERVGQDLIDLRIRGVKNLFFQSTNLVVLKDNLRVVRGQPFLFDRFIAHE